MKKKQPKIELLAPAGSPEKLKYAFQYGADAVYCGIPDVSMRARINTFTQDTLKESVEYAHSLGKRIYVTLNIYAHNYHLDKVEEHLKFLKKIEVDGVIVSDPGILMLVKKHLPETEIHLSTQANTTNWQAAKFWYELGIKRVVLAREVTLEDIKEIHKRVPGLELEYFVHGAMCMSYSGRCILSKWMSGRSANEGDCSQPCRWGYRETGNLQRTINDKKIQKADEELPVFKTMEVEDIRGEHQVELEEDRHGTYFFNSKDLNLLANLQELVDAGVVSLKIEGRNKSVYYLATVVRAYRKVLDAINAKMPEKEIKKVVKKEAVNLDELVHRGYTAGFLLGNEPEHAFRETHQESAHQFVGEVLAVENKLLTVKAHNAIYQDEKIEVIGPTENVAIKVKKITDENGELVVSAHGGHGKLYYFEVDRKDIAAGSLLRKAVKSA